MILRRFDRVVGLTNNEKYSLDAVFEPQPTIAPIIQEGTIEEPYNDEHEHGGSQHRLRDSLGHYARNIPSKPAIVRVVLSDYMLPHSGPWNFVLLAGKGDQSFPPHGNLSTHDTILTSNRPKEPQGTSGMTWHGSSSSIGVLRLLTQPPPSFDSTTSRGRTEEDGGLLTGEGRVPSTCAETPSCRQRPSA